MTTAIDTETQEAIVYPDSDGRPMADNTLQFRWIVTIEGGIDALFSDDPNVFVAGDLMSLVQDGQPVPGVAPAALQSGRHAAENVLRAIRGEPTRPFRYLDKGSMATINRFSAVAQINERIQFRGFIAWLMWLAVHLFYLIGFRNRFVAVLQWGVAFIGRARPGFVHAAEAEEREEVRLAG